MSQNSETSHKSSGNRGWRPNGGRELDNMAPLRTAGRVLLVCDDGVFRCGFSPPGVGVPEEMVVAPR